MEFFPQERFKDGSTYFSSTPVILCRTLAPEMAKAKKGKIVNITSLAVLYPLPFMPMYNSCKSALSSFTRSLMLWSTTVIQPSLMLY